MAMIVRRQWSFDLIPQCVETVIATSSEVLSRLFEALRQIFIQYEFGQLPRFVPDNRLVL